MKQNDFKNSINSIEPKAYAATRIFANIKNVKQAKQKGKKKLKAAICTAVCFCVLAAGLGIGIPKTVTSDSAGNAVEPAKDNYFVMSVYAAENEKNTATPIAEEMVCLPDYKLEKFVSSDGMGVSFADDSDGFNIKGKNIKTVKIKCETGSCSVWDWDMLNYLRDNNMYYDVIVPYSEEYENHTVEERRDILLNHIKNGDYDVYIEDKNIKADDEYRAADFVYDKDENVVGVGLVSNEMFNRIHASESAGWGTLKEYTFENVLNKTDLGGYFQWFPDVSKLLDNSDLPFNELPHDTISIEVTFNDNSVQHASYDFSFNENGELVVQRIAE